MIQKSLVAVLTIACILQFACKGSQQVSSVKQRGEVVTKMQEPVLIGGYTKAQIYFKIQIGAFKKQLQENDPFWKGVIDEEIQEEISSEGLYRYTLGYFKTYEAAEAYEKKMKGKGYHSAFVAAYGNDNRRIDLPMTEILRLYRHGY